jgi:putative nucleotidyltransferase with HDIG domain
MSASQKPRIIFVDDVPEILAGLRQSLRKERKRWDLVFACGGEEALRAVDAGTPNVLVTDMQMPGMNGAVLLREVADRAPECLRFVLSGEPSSVLSLQAAPFAHQWLSKPCARETLVGTIARSLAVFSRLRSVTVQNLVLSASPLPSPPETYQALLSAVQTPEFEMDHLAGIVERDPALAARVLQLTNSSFCGRRQQIASVRDAVASLGWRQLTDLVLASELFESWGGDAAHSCRPSAIVKHAQRVVGAARYIAEDVGLDPDACLAAALLHDIGTLLLASRLPDFESRLVPASPGEPRHLAEMRELGCTHADLGGALLLSWGLPLGVVDAVTYHHTPVRSEALTFDHVGIVHAANAVATGEAPDFEFLEAMGVADKFEKWSTFENDDLAPDAAA